MGKRNRFKEAKRQNAQVALSAVLRTHSQRHDRAAAVVSYGDFSPAYGDRIEAYRPQILRAPETWRCRVKSRGEDKRFIDLVRHTFARYRVPPHLENVWIEEFDDDFLDQVTAPARRARDLRAAGPARLGDRGRARRLAVSASRPSVHVEARGASLPCCAR